MSTSSLFSHYRNTVQRPLRLAHRTSRKYLNRTLDSPRCSTSSRQPPHRKAVHRLALLSHPLYRNDHNRCRLARGLCRHPHQLAQPFLNDRTFHSIRDTHTTHKFDEP